MVACSNVLQATLKQVVDYRKGISIMGKLVLCRKEGESFELFDPTNEAFGVITITQQRIRGNKSSISIEAPANVRVKRTELATKPKKSEVA